MRKVFKRFPFYRIFVSLFVIFYTFFPSVQAIGIVVEDYASDDISEVEVDSSEDILDEGISDPEWIANPELLEEDDEEEEDEPLFVYEDGVYTVFNVIEDEEYVYPNNENVRIEFTSITEEGDLNISRVTLTEQQREELNTTDEYGWSITSSMSNGSFEYNLTLPNTLGNDVEVKYSSEDSGEFNSIEDVVVNEDVIYMERLDHFTVFVVVNPIPNDEPEGSICEVAGIEGICYETIQAAINAAGEDDVVWVADGTYDEDIVINQSKISLISANKHGATLKGLVRINANEVIFDGFKMREYQVGGGGHPVIEVIGEYVTVQNLDMYLENFISVQPYEIRVQSTGNNAQILNNVINRGWFGGHPSISFAQGIDILIQGNELGGTGTSAIGGGGGGGNTVIIRNNIVHYGYDEGIWFWPVHENGIVILEGNTVHNYNYGGKGSSAIKITNKPASINGETNTAKMLEAIEEDNPGIETVLLQWMDNVHNYTQDTFYSTIQGAIDDADDGDTIKALPGTYEESIVVNKSLTLLGAQADVDPRPSQGGRTGDESIIKNNWTALDISANNVIVNGFTFESHITSSSPNVVQAVDAEFPSIIYNIVYNVDSDARSNEGIKVRKSYDTGALVSYNYVYDIPSPGDAINFDRVNGGEISHNEVRNIGSENAAIYIYDSENSIVRGNILDITTQNDGIKLGNKGGQDRSKSGGLVEVNIVSNTVQDGITIYMSDTIVRGNSISESTSENGALYLAFDISNITIEENNIFNNNLRTHKHSDAAGIFLGSNVNSSTVTIENNNVYNNTPYGVTNKTGTQLDATLNWWGHITGPSGQGTGSGDSVSENVIYHEWLCEPYETDWTSNNGVCGLEAPTQIGYKVQGNDQLLNCLGTFTNVNAVAVHWEVDDYYQQGNFKYLRQYKVGNGSWTGSEIYTDLHTNYRTFGGVPGNDGVYGSRLKVFYDKDDTGTYNLGDPVSDWSNECFITYDTTIPDQIEGIQIFRGHNSEQDNLLGCNGYTNDPRIRIEWEPSEDPDIDYYWFGTKFNERHQKVYHPITHYDGNMTPGHNPYYYTIIAVDKAGNESPISESCYLTLDQEDPTIPTNLRFETLDGEELGCSNYTSEFEIIAKWDESTDNNEIAHYEYRSFNPPNGWKWGTPVIHTTQRRGALNQGEGAYGFKVRAVDLAGNTSEWTAIDLDSSCQITYDITAPIVTITSPSEGEYIRGTVDLIGDIEELHLWRYFYRVRNTDTGTNVTSRTVYSDSLANETFYTWDTTQSDDGEYLIHLAARDLAGNREYPESEDNITVIVDNTAPTGSIDYIYYSSRDVTVPTFITNDNTPVLGGTCSDNMGLDTVVLEINGQTYPVVCDDEDKWRFDSLYELPDGEHTATLTLTDLAGNETIETQNVTIDTVAPTAVHTYYRNGEEITDSIAYVQGIEDITFTGVYEDEDPSSGLYKDVFVIFRNDLQFYCAWNQVLTGGVSLNGSDFYELNDHQSLTDCVDFLEDGSYHIRHRIYDHATRSSDPLFYQHREYINLNFVVDTEAPTSEFIPDISDSYHNSLPIVLSGTTVDENNVDYVELHITPVGDSDNTIVVTLPNESNSSVFNWTYSDWEPEEGVYDIYAHGVDLAGNVENTSIVTNVTFDTTPPEITNLSVSIDYLGLYVNGINGFTIYADVYDTLSGIDPNSCEYTLDGSNWHSGTYNSTDGRCQFDVSSSDLFNNQALGIQVSVMDLAGNSSESGVLNRTVDANYPTSDVTLEYEYYGPNRLPIITGTASDTVSGVQYVNITIQRNSDDKYWDQNLGWVSDTTMLPTVGTETWIYPELLGGLENTVSYSVTPYATDNVDNTAQGVSTSFVWDNEPPTVPQNLHISDPNIQCNWYTNSNVVQFQWNPSTDTLSGVKNYEFYYNNPELVEPEIWDMGGNHTTTSINLHLNFGEGEYSLRVRAIDNIGNIGGWSDECTVTFDETAPTVEIDPSRSPDWEGWYSTRPDYNNVPPTFSIISDDTEAYLEYQWNDKNDNGWQAYTTEGIEYPEDGIHTLYIKGTDFAGNVGEDQLEAWFDFTSPVGTFLQIPDSNGYVRGTIELNFEGVYDPSGSEEIARVQIWVGNQLIGSADHIGGQEYTFDLDTTLLGDGQHNVTGSIFDRAGNRTMISQSIVVDNTAPEITFELPINEEIVSGEVDLQATCNEDCTYINFWWRKDGESYSNTTPERNYHYVWEQGTLFEWTLDTLNAERWGGDPSYIMEDGVYYLYAAGKDLAGNWASTPEVMIIVDNTPPETTLKEDPSGTYTNEPINIAGTSTDILSNVVNLTLEYRETGQGDEAWLEIPASELNSEENPLENPAPSTSWNWAVTWTPSDDGTYDIRAYATDQVGNVEGSAYIEGVTYDTTSPEVFLELIAGILSVSVEDILSGKDTIEVRIGEDGEWLEYEEGMNLNELVDGQPGTYTVYVRVADKAGNTTIASGTFTIPSPPPTTPEEVLGAIIAPFTPQPALALGTGGPVYTYTTSVTEDTDVEDDELEEEDIDDQDDIEDEDTDVRGVEDENDIDEEDDGGIRWWIYPLVILPLILIFFILWKRRKDDEENNQY